MAKDWTGDKTTKKKKKTTKQSGAATVAKTAGKAAGIVKEAAKAAAKEQTGGGKARQQAVRSRSTSDANRQAQAEKISFRQRNPAVTSRNQTNPYQAPEKKEQKKIRPKVQVADFPYASKGTTPGIDNGEYYSRNTEKVKGKAAAAKKALKNTPEIVEKSAKQAVYGHLTTANDIAAIESKKNGKTFEGDVYDPELAEKSRKKAKENVYKYASKANDEEKKIQEITKGSSGLEKAYYGAVESGTGMLTDRLAGLGTNTGSLAAMFSRTYGTTRSKAMREGATEDEDRLNAFLQAAKETATERIFVGAGLAKGFAGKGSLSLANRISNRLTKNLTGPAANVVGSGTRLLAGSAEENAEEAIAWGFDPLITEFAYGRNVRERQARATLQAESDNLRAQVTDEDTARAIAAYLSSDDFLDKNRQEYIAAGIPEGDAIILAGHMRDYLTASLTGDTEKMQELEDEIVKTVAGKGLSKESWDFGELKDTIASTTLLTLATGLPGTVISSRRGASYKSQLGNKGIAALAKTSVDFEDAQDSMQGQVMADRLNDGKELTDIQAFELVQGFQRQVQKDEKRVTASRNAAQEQMDKQNLVAPYVETEDGHVELGDVTSQEYNKAKKSATTAVRAVNNENKGNESLSIDDSQVRTAAEAIAAFQTGVMTVDDANQLTYSNKVAREAFKQETGIDLDDYIVKDKGGEVNIPKTNTAIKNALFAMASDNLVKSAQAETVDWMDHTKGEVVSNISARMGAAGTQTLQQALDDVDERNRSEYLMVANATDMLYQAGRNLGTEWANLESEARSLFPGIDSSKLRMMYQAGLDDRDMATDEARNRQVEIGKKLSEVGEQETSTGKLFIDTKTPLKGTVIRTFTEIAQNLGADIHLTDAIKNVDGDVIDRANGAYDPKTNTYYLNVSTGVEKNIGYIFMHETTHFLKIHAPEQYQALENLVREKWFQFDASQMQDAIARKIAAYNKATKGKQTLTEEEALEEIIADASHEFLRDPDFAKQVAESDDSIAKSVLNTIRNTLRMLRRLFATGSIEDQTHMNSLFSMLDIYDEAEKLWLDAYTQAVKNKAAAGIVEWDERAKLSSNDAIRNSLDADYTIQDGNARWTDDRIDSLISEYGASNLDYSQAYAVLMSPRDFLKLTLRDEMLNRWNEGANSPEHPEVFSLREEKLQRSGKVPRLWIKSSNNTNAGFTRVTGHEGRHRMRALWEAGIESVPIAIIDNDTKYTKKPEEMMTLLSQDFGDGPVNNDARVGLWDLVPIKESNRAELQKKFGGQAQVRFSVSDDHISSYSTAAYSGQVNMRSDYKMGDNVLGYVDWSIYDDKPSISFIEVDKAYRRQGIARKLLQDIQRQYPDTEINFGMTTEDGTALVDAITYDVVDEDIKSRQKELDQKRQELEQLEIKLNEFYDSFDGEMTENELDEGEKLGDRYDALEKEIRDLEEEVGNKSATHRLIKFSITAKDNEGKSLSEDQQTFFRYVAPELKDENGNIKRFYHGTGRADRVGYCFDPERATSGPMAYFTDNKEIATNYSQNKQDTSLAYEGDDIHNYHNQFVVDVDGEEVRLEDYWNMLPASDRVKFRERAGHITRDWDTYELTYDENVTNGNGGYGNDPYLVRKARGNAFTMLIDAWLDSGDFFGEEENFLEVMELLGMEGVKYKDPNYREEKVYEVYLNVTNPLVTSYIDDEFVADVKDWVDATDLDFYAKESAHADMWDKNSVDPYDWIERLESDVENNTTHAWTSIPDVITDFLKEQGYDGIVDRGGKGGGIGHQVVIPFSSEQIKDINNEHPTKENPDIRYSIAAKYDEDYMAAVEANDMDKAQELVDMAAAESGMRVAHRYHGSMNANFTVFDKAYAKVGGNSGAGFYFSTEEEDSVNHYQDVEGADNYFKWSELAERILSDGEWNGEEVTDHDRAVEIAKEELNQNPGTYDVYLNYKNPYVRNYGQSTDLFEYIMDGFDESVVDRQDYDTDEDYEDDLVTYRDEYFFETINNAVYAAYDQIEGFYDYVDLPPAYRVAEEIAGHYDYNLNWNTIEEEIYNMHEVVLFRDDWDDSAGDGTRELTRAIIENLGFDAVEDKEVSSKFGQLSREMMTDTEHIIVFKPEQIKLSDPVTYAEDGSVIPLSERFDPNNDDIRYSLPTEDSDGNVLSDGQMEFFKNSQARDQQGKLVPVYHTTNKGGFTVFDPWYSDDKRSLFFASNWHVSQTYGRRATERFEFDENARFDSWQDFDKFARKAFGLDKSDSLASELDIEVLNNYGDRAYELGSTKTAIFKKWLKLAESNDPKSRKYKIRMQTPYGNDYITAKTMPSLLQKLEVAMAAHGQTSGYYAAYLNLENPLIVDAKGANWDSIPYGESKLSIKNMRWSAEPEWDQTEDGDPLLVGYQIDFEYEFLNDSGEWELNPVLGNVFNNPNPDNTDWFPRKDAANLFDSNGIPAKYINDVLMNADENPMDGSWEYETDEDEEISFSDTYKTRELARIAETQGHDGVIIRNCRDLAGTSSFRGTNPMSDIYIAFSAEQVKDISNENPTENPDIRYSVVDEDSAMEWLATQYDIDDVPLADEQAEEGRIRMAKSKKDFVTSKNVRWNERWLTEGKVLDPASTKTKIRQLVMGAMANSDTSRQYKSEIVDNLLVDAKSAFWLMKDDKHSEAAELLWNSASKMIENVEFIDDEVFNNYKDLRDYMRTANFRLGEEYWSDVDFAAFRKQNFGRMKIVKGDTNIDEIYQEMQERWPEWFNEDEAMTPPDMLLQIEHVLDTVQPYKIAYSSEEAAEFAGEIASDLYDIVYEGKEYKSIADTYKERYDKKTKALKARHEEALRKVKENSKKAIDKERTKFKEYKQKQKNAKEKAKHFGRIASNIDWLTDRLLNETKDKNIPEGFRRSLAHLLMQFDMQTERSKKLEEKYGPAKKTLQMRELKSRLEKIANEDDTGEFRYDGYLFYLMDALAEKVDGNSIDSLDTEDLVVIDTMLKSICHNFRNYNKVRLEEKSIEISSIGDKTIAAMEERINKFGKRKSYGGARGLLDKLVNEGEETPIYLFERIDPTGEGIGAMYKELRRGEDQHIRNMHFLRQRFQALFGEYFNKKKPGSELEGWRDDSQAQTFNLANGSITLNPAQIMSLYCLSKRQQALGHILGAGIVASPVNINQKLAQQFKGKEEQVNSVMVTYDEIQTIIATLTPEQVKLADEMQSLMNNEMAAWGNETSLQMHGIKLFREKDYFPIKSSGESLTKTADSFQAQEKIKNFGFTKPLVRNANNAIMIDDIFSVVADHCNKMSLYNAMAIPISDFMRVYNYKQKFDDGSVKTVQQAIGEAYTRKVNDYIMKFISDVNGNTQTRSDAVNDLMNKALANYKKASIGMNARVALQQPTAIFRSFMAIDPKYFAGIKLSPKETREMFEHCPIALWKSWGHYDMDMGRDIEDIMMNNDWSRWDAVSMGVYGALDNVTWSLIWQACKNEVKAKNPGVEVGSEEFFKLANERASEVFDKTQVVDSIFHRSDTMRSKNTLTKMATSFMAEPTLTFNVMRDSLVKGNDQWKDGDRAGAAKTWTKMFAVLALNAAAVSAAAAVWDAVRGKGADDDEDKRFADLWFANFIENLKDNANIINNIYFVKDIWSLKDGWGTSNMALEGWETFFTGLTQFKKKITAGSDKSWYDIMLNLLGGVGYITGVPIKTMMRDARAIAKKIGLDVFAAVEDDEAVSEDKANGLVNRIFGKDDKDDKEGKEASGSGTSESKSKTETKKPTEEETVAKIEEKASKHQGDSDALWDIVSDGYTKKLEDGDFAYISRMRKIYEDNGGDVDKFDEKIMAQCPAAYKRTLKEDMTDEDIERQEKIKSYMLAHGVSEEELSDMCYHTYTAKDLKAALRMGNHDYIIDELVKLVRAGLSREDFEKLYKNRYRGAKYYDGKYSRPEYRQSTGVVNWPITGEITSGFGHRASPGGIGSTNHMGIDIAASMGDPIGAADGGTVIFVGWEGNGGNVVKIRHDDGSVTEYKHMSAFNCHAGDQVAQGQQIGQVGSTGNSTGPHLHFGYIDPDGNYQDPLQILAQ